jgi:hypothetical protein
VLAARLLRALGSVESPDLGNGSGRLAKDFTHRHLDLCGLSPRATLRR